MTRTASPDCPHCRSTNVATTNLGRKSAVMLGGLAGGISSAATVWIGARIGATLGSAAGPAGAVLNAVAGAIAALAGAAAGCAAGGVVVDLIDNKVLNNYHCMDCDHSFSQASPHAKGNQPPRAPAHPYGPEPLPKDSDWEVGNEGREEGDFPHRGPRD